MEIREPQPLIKLFIASFNIVNHAFGRLVVYFILAGLGCVLQAVLLALRIPPFVGGLFNMIYSAFLSVLLFKIIASQAETDLASLSDLMASSVLPAIYTLILFLLLGIVAGIVTFISAFISHLISPVFILAFALVALFFMTRLLFAPMLIALREQAPIHALIHSWELTGGHFFRVLVALLLSAVFPLLCVGGLIYGLYVGIPLYFADSFNIVHLTPGWWIAFALLAILLVVIQLSMVSFLVLVFLNLDYTQSEQPAAQAPTAYEKGTVMARASTVSQTVAPDVKILKASVKTHPSDESLSQHLNEVYQPRPETAVNQTEEDRMPTIVFDDEMAAQMARERAQWEQEKAKNAQQANNSPEDNGNGFIKMSK